MDKLAHLEAGSLQILSHVNPTTPIIENSNNAQSVLNGRELDNANDDYYDGDYDDDIDNDSCEDYDELDDASGTSEQDNQFTEYTHGNLPPWESSEIENVPRRVQFFPGVYRFALPGWPAMPVGHQVQNPSNIGSDIDEASDTTYNTNISKYTEYNGRLYQRNRFYWEPYDTMQAYTLKVLHNAGFEDNELISAPIYRPSTIVDWGTGNGIWAVQVASQYNLAYVRGLDLSSRMLPGNVPSNCKFQVDDINERWTFSADLIHMRFMDGCVTNWDETYQQARRRLNHNGWLEQEEMWLCAEQVPSWETWERTRNSAGSKRGHDFGIVHKMMDLMDCAGFQDIESFEYSITGRHMLVDVHDRIGFLLTKLENWTEEQVETLKISMIEEAVQHLDTPLYTCRRVWGRSEKR